MPYNGSIYSLREHYEDIFAELVEEDAE